MCFTIEQKPNSREHEDSLGWLRPKTRLAFHSTHRKDIRASSSLFTRRASDVTSEAFSTAMSGDRYEGPKHNRGHSDAIVINMNFNSYSSLARILFFTIPVLSCFVFLFNGSLRPRKKRIKKKYQSHLFSFILCIMFHTFLWIWWAWPFGRGKYPRIQNKHNFK